MASALRHVLVCMSLYAHVQLLLVTSSETEVLTDASIATILKRRLRESFDGYR